MNSVTSDRDYLEIIADGYTTLSATASGDADAAFPANFLAEPNYGILTIDHNLGTVAMVRVFYDPDKNGTLYNTLKYTGGSYLAYGTTYLSTANRTTQTKIILNASSAVTNIPIYYRVYSFDSIKSTTSDRKMDKIFLGDTGQATLGAAANSDTPTVTIQPIGHPYNEAVLNTLQFSEDAVTWYSAGNPLYGSADTTTGPPVGPYSRYFYTLATGYSDATTFYIRYEHNYATSKTIYVRYTLDLR